MKFIVYEANDGWRWHSITRNGKLMSESGEAYVSEANARRALRRYLELVLDAITNPID